MNRTASVYVIGFIVPGRVRLSWLERGVSAVVKHTKSSIDDEGIETAHSACHEVASRRRAACQGLLVCERRLCR